MQGGSYRVAFAMRDGDEIVHTAILNAPSAETESDALAGLRVRACDLLRDRGVTRMALWSYEGSPRGIRVTAARPVMRAEGVVIACAGEIGVDALEISASSERQRGGHRTNDELVATRVGNLRGSWEPDAVRAVAASTFA